MKKTALLLTAFLLTAFAAKSNTYIVSITANAGVGSLRAAIDSANNNPGLDSIIITLGPTDTISVLSPFQAVSDSLVITGLPCSNPTLSGGNIAFSQPAFYISNTNIPLTLNYLNFSGFLLTGNFAQGGVVFSVGYLYLDYCYFNGNSAISNSFGIGASDGGAVFAETGLTAYNSTFSNNAATTTSGPGSLGGGAVWAQNGNLYNCTFYQNQANEFASALYLYGNSNVINCTFVSNSATDGGVIFNNQSSPYNNGGINIANSIFWGNTGNGSDPGGIWFPGATANSGGCNILQTSSANGGFATTGTDVQGVDPQLGTFGYHGGCVPTIPIRCGSVAQNHASCPGATTTDARGVAAFGTPDAGAYELSPPPAPNLGPNVSHCGGDVQLVASPVTTGNTYLWSTGATTDTINADSSGLYNVLVTDSEGCTGTASVDIYIKPVPQVSLGNNVTQCGGNVQLIASSDTTVNTYLWSTGATTDTIKASSSGLYSVLVTDTEGCTGTSSINVYINPAPQVSLGNNVTQCSGTVTLDAGNVGDLYLWSTGATTQTIAVDTTNTYNVVVTDSASGCSASASTHVTIDSLPVVNLGGPYTQCGGTVTLNAFMAGATYAWSDGSSNSKLAVSTSGYYQVTVTNSNNCSGAGSATVTINPVPSVYLPADTSACGSSLVPNAGSGPGYQYFWQDESSNQTETAFSNGNYSVTVTNSYNCTASAQSTVTLLNAPVVNLGPGINQCGGESVLNAGNPGDGYSWSDGSSGQFDTASTSGTYSVTVTNPADQCTASGTIQVYIQTAPYVNLGNDTTQCGGTVTLNAANPGDLYSWSTSATTETITVNTSNNYSVTVTDPNGGCSATGTVSVNILPVPVVNLGPDTTQCGGSVTLNAGNPGDSYLWSNNSTSSSITATTPGLYSVTVTNQSACSASASVNVYIQTVPSVYLGQPITQCGGTVTLDAANPGYGYLWSTTATSQTIQVDTTGTYWVTVTNLINSCSTEDSINVTIDTLPVVNLGPDTTQCGGTVTLNAGNAGSTYLWSDNSSNQTLVVSASGIYRVTVTNGNGCSATDTITVTINPVPVVTLSLPANVCITVPAFNLSGGQPSGIGGVYYEADTVINVFNPYWQNIGSHEITYVYTNSFGCSDSDSAAMYVQPQPSITTVTPPYLCTTSPEINLNNYFTPQGGAYTGVGVSGNFFYPNLAPPGLDHITDIYTDTFGCMDTSVYAIEVHVPVHVSLIPSVADFTICQNQSITFTSGGAEFYQFFVNDSAMGPPSTDSTFTTTTLVNRSVVFVVGSNPCSTDTSEPIVIDVITPPVVSAGTDTTITLGQSVELNGTATGDGALTYLWTPGNGLNFINVPNPTYSGSDTITFWFKATDHYGCADSAQVTIDVYVPDNVQLPNVITPNGDGYNDVWQLNPKIDLDGSHLVIFDRWGQVVYETENYANNWGGTYKSTGKLLPDDTYYYVLTVPVQNNHVYEGAINIISGSTK